MELSVLALEKQLRRLGIHAVVEGGAPHSLVLTRGASSRRYVLTDNPRDVVARPETTERDASVLVWTEHLNPRTADALRTLGCQYVTGSGNAWLEFGDVLIDIRGHARSVASRGRQHRVDGNPFTPAGAQVVLAYLGWPDLWTAPQRDVAHAAGVSLGQVNKTRVALQESGLDPGKPQSRRQLLEVWAAIYPGGLGAKLVEAEYEGEVHEGIRGTDVSGPIEVSGELAVSRWIRPASATLYVADVDPYLAVVNRWRAGEHPNILVRRKFWTDPVEHVGSPGETRVAPWPLVYADLRASKDSRARAAAMEWRDEHL